MSQFRTEISKAFILMEPLIVVAIIAFVTSSAPAAPTSAGLELRLSANLLPGTTETFHLRAELNNTTDRDITFIRKLYTGDGHPTQDQFFTSQTSLEVEPPVMPLFYGTEYSPPVGKLDFTVPARKSIAYQWVGFCNCLKPDVAVVGPFPQPCLPEPGRYALRPSFHGRTSNDQRIQVDSKPTMIDFGNSSRAPVHTVLKLVQVDSNTSQAVFTPGANGGISAAQEFRLADKTGNDWRFRPTEVSSHSCTGILKQVKEGYRNFTHLNAGTHFYRTDQTGGANCGSETAGRR